MVLLPHSLLSPRAVSPLTLVAFREVLHISIGNFFYSRLAGFEPDWSLHLDCIALPSFNYHHRSQCLNDEPPTATVLLAMIIHRLGDLDGDC